MTGWLFAAAGVLVAGAWIAHRRRMARLKSDALTDADIQRIEQHGRVEAEEPLDFEEAAEEEERFWGETWDEPEPL